MFKWWQDRKALKQKELHECLAANHQVLISTLNAEQGLTSKAVPMEGSQWAELKLAEPYPIVLYNEALIYPCQRWAMAYVGEIWRARYQKRDVLSFLPTFRDDLTGPWGNEIVSKEQYNPMIATIAKRARLRMMSERSMKRLVEGYNITSIATLCEILGVPETQIALRLKELNLV